MTPDAPRSPDRRGHLLALILAAGAVAVALAATPYRTFDLDRHAVPKELALHLTAMLAGSTALLTRREKPLQLARPDLFLIGYLLLSLLSVLATTNHWLGVRALAISVSSAVCYWSARQAAALGAGSLVRGGVAIAILLAAATGLLQAYGVTLSIFAETRSPGGTFGNRNFLAHVSAIGLPLYVSLAIGARRGVGTAVATLGLVAATAILVLSRSRAAWLGGVAGVGMLGLWALVGARPELTLVRRRRLALLAAAMTSAVILAMLLPNRLRWTVANPYSATVANIVDAKDGSGRGRLIQYRNTLKLVAQDPVLGVGPGNWAVRYPTVTYRGDPAYVPGATVPTNPWPSSDWVALVAERGAAAVLLLAFAFVGLAVRAWRAARARDVEAWGAAGVAAALLTVGTFDAVLLNAAPALLAFTALGATVAINDSSERRRPLPRWLTALGALVVLAGVVRSSQSLTALARFDGARTLQQQTRAATIDPGNYRLRWLVGHAWLARGNREIGCVHARAAGAQFPHTEAARRLARRCARR